MLATLLLPLCLFGISIIFTLLLTNSKRKKDINNPNVRKMLEQVKINMSSSEDSLNDTVAKAEERLNNQKSQAYKIMSELDHRIEVLENDNAELQSLQKALNEYRSKLIQLNRSSDEAHGWALKVQEEGKKIEEIKDLIDAHSEKVTEIIQNNNKAQEQQKEKYDELVTSMKDEMLSVSSQIHQMSSEALASIEQKIAEFHDEKEETALLQNKIEDLKKTVYNLKDETDTYIDTSVKNFTALSDQIIQESKSTLDETKESICLKTAEEMEKLSTEKTEAKIKEIDDSVEVWLEKLDGYYKEMAENIHTYTENLYENKEQFTLEIETIKATATHELSQLGDDLDQAKEKVSNEVALSMEKHYALIAQLEDLDKNQSIQAQKNADKKAEQLRREENLIKKREELNAEEDRKIQTASDLLAKQEAEKKKIEKPVGLKRAETEWQKADAEKLAKVETEKQRTIKKAEEEWQKAENEKLVKENTIKEEAEKSEVLRAEALKAEATDVAETTDAVETTDKPEETIESVPLKNAEEERQKEEEKNIKNEEKVAETEKAEKTSETNRESEEKKEKDLIQKEEVERQKAKKEAIDAEKQDTPKDVQPMKKVEGEFDTTGAGFFNLYHSYGKTEGKIQKRTEETPEEIKEKLFKPGSIIGAQLKEVQEEKKKETEGKSKKDTEHFSGTVSDSDFWFDESDEEEVINFDDDDDEK